jgi:exopolyphosphatase/guanosine-5'-triphosphate,3'-diphosphate pyrophosphatase
MRVAAIDVGTNSIHLLVVDVLPDGSVKLVEKARSQVMLGSGGLGKHEITPEAFQRGITAIEGFKAACDSLEVVDVHAAATSAVREASNGEEFCAEVKRRTDIHVRIISGVDEARLIYLGARSDLHFHAGRVALVDVGGGSTEFVLCDRNGPLHLQSLPLGHIRLTDMFRSADTLTSNERQAIKRHVRATLVPLLKRIRRGDVGAVVGTSGTVRCLARMATLERGEPLPEHDQGLVLRRKEVERLISRFSDLPTDRLGELPGMDMRRRHTLPAGAIIVREALKALDVDHLTTSDRSLRDGLIADWIARHRPELDLSRTVQQPRERSVLLAMQRFGVDEAHALHVAKLSTSIFEHTAPLHELPATDRELLRAAAMLHDIGHHIAGKSHHKHGQYLLKNIRMYGYTAPEMAIISNLVRYHSRSRPKAGHADFALLSSDDRRRVRVMAGILQIADALDRSHNQPVESLDVRVDGAGVVMTATCTEGGELERWAANERVGLLASALGRPCKVVVVNPVIA